MHHPQDTPTSITLLQPHRHAGRDYPAGSTLTLPARKADWLIAIGVARSAPPAPAPAEPQPATATKAPAKGKE